MLTVFDAVMRTLHHKGQFVIGACVTKSKTNKSVAVVRFWLSHTIASCDGDEV